MSFWMVLLFPLLLLQQGEADAAERCITVLDPDAAIEACDEAIEDDPENANLYQFRAYAYLQIDDNVAAIDDYNTLLELDPDNAIAYHNRASAWALRGNQELAIQDYTRAIELEPDYVDAYINRGVAYVNTEQYDLAIADYQRALELDSSSADAFVELGYAYSYNGDYELALEAYQNAIDLDEELTDAYGGRAYTYLNLGDNRRAIQNYTRALEMGGGDDIELYYGRGYAQAALGNYEEALADYELALEIELREDILFSRAEMYYELERYDDALLEFQGIIGINSAYSAGSWLNIARIYERTEQMDLALEAAQEYYDIYQQYELFIPGELPPSERAIFEVGFEQQWAIPHAHYYVGSLVVSAYSQDGVADPIVMVIDPDGNVVAFSDNSYELDGRDARLYYGVRIPERFTIILTYVDPYAGEVEVVIGADYD